MVKNLASYIVTLLLVSMAIISCIDDTTMQEDDNSNEFDIYFGSFGGLCGFSDSMSITVNLDLDYTLTDFCTDTNFETDNTISQDQYSSLINLLTISNFQKLNYNSCDRCVDGLDTFLHIDGDDFTHRIVYGFKDDLSSIQDFVDRLNDIRESVKPQ